MEGGAVADEGAEFRPRAGGMWAGFFALDKQCDGGIRGGGAVEEPPAAACLNVLDALIGGLDTAETFGVGVR